MPCPRTLLQTGVEIRNNFINFIFGSPRAGGWGAARMQAGLGGAALGLAHELYK